MRPPTEWPRNTWIDARIVWKMRERARETTIIPLRSDLVSLLVFKVRLNILADSQDFLSRSDLENNARTKEKYSKNERPGEGGEGVVRIEEVNEEDGENSSNSSKKVCPFVCRRALLDLQSGIPFKDRPSCD
jgi:hypothetical protein